MKKITYLSVFALAAALTLGFSGADAQAGTSDKVTNIKNLANTELNKWGDITGQQVIGAGINILMMFMGAIMFGLVVYGGVLWMTANGNSDQISKAKNIIVWAGLGVFAMLSSYLLVSFVFKQFVSQ